MRKLSFLAIAYLVSMTLTALAQANYYVSPGGSDSNPGTLDAPFATVEKAQSMVRTSYLSNCAAQAQPIVVMLRGGLWQQQALSFTQSDSGCSTSVPVVYENYPGEMPTLSGGMRVANWLNITGAAICGGNTNCWQTTLPANSANFEALYYDGVRRSRPRLGTGALGSYFRIVSKVPSYYDRFVYNGNDPISTTWENYAPTTGNPCGQIAGPVNLQGDIEILVFEQWSVSRQRISCIDTVSHTIYLTGNTVKDLHHGYIANHRYLIENVKDQLNSAGQWFLDRSVSGAWTLTYLGNPGENPNSDTVIIPQQRQVLVATGLMNVTFHGITFSGDNFVAATTGYAGSQGEIQVPPAVQCMNCSNVTFDSDTFTNTTGYGLGMLTDNNGTATGDSIQNSAFYDLGAGGIILGRNPSGKETDSNVLQFTTVQNNIVQGYGRMYVGAAGIAPLLSHDLTITHNDVTGGYNQGIMVCVPNDAAKCKGMTNSQGEFNVTVSFNHVWNLGQGILSDLGGVYFATYAATGNASLNNKVHDIYDDSVLDKDGYGGHGIYVDRGGPIDVENNLVYRVAQAGTYITLGPTAPNQIITYKNNIFAYSRRGVIVTGRCDTTNIPQFVFENNLVYQNRTSRVLPPSSIQGQGFVYLGDPVGSLQLFISNLYWSTVLNFAADKQSFKSQTSVCGARTYYNLAGWQKIGEDIGSVVKNPNFANPAYPADDYWLPNGSPGVGFVPFDTSGTCVTCPGRLSPLIMPPVLPEAFPTAPFNPATDF